MPDPLEGVTLKTIVAQLVEAYGWETLARDIPIRCFSHSPSISSSLHFLRRTPWARAKVENLYREHLKAEARSAAMKKSADLPVT